MKITIERGKKKYIVHLQGDCSKNCSFRKFQDGEYCFKECRLPKWFHDVIIKIMNGGYSPYLEEVI